MPWSSKENTYIDILQRHHHSPTQVYGSNSGWAGVDACAKWTVTGGNNTWGTELNMSVLNGGTAGTKFDLNTLFVASVTAANKISVIEFRANTLGPEITAITSRGTPDDFVKTGHGLVAGNKVIITNLATTTGVDALTVYYVINVVGDSFQLSLTEGGAAVPLTNDGTAAMKKIIASDVITKTIVSMAGTNSDAVPIPMNSIRVDATRNISVRAKSETGSTIGIGFLIGCHTYNF